MQPSLPSPISTRLRRHSAVLPDLDEPFHVPDYIVCALREHPGAYETFEAFPEFYKRARISYIDGSRDREEEFARRLGNFVRKTAAGEMFGNWNDDGRLS